MIFPGHPSSAPRPISHLPHCYLPACRPLEPSRSECLRIEGRGRARCASWLPREPHAGAGTGAGDVEAGPDDRWSVQARR